MAGAPEAAAADHERREAPGVAPIGPRAHGAQRVEHARHRARVERRIPAQHREERPPGTQAREESHRRARIAAVHDLGGLAEAVEPSADHPDPAAGVGHADLHAQRPQCRTRGGDVAARGEVREPALAVGDTGSHERAMRDPLAAGKAEPPAQGRTTDDLHDVARRVAHGSTARAWW